MSRGKKPRLAFSGTIEAGKKKKLSQHAKACRDRVGELSTTESKPLPTLDSERVSGARSERVFRQKLSFELLCGPLRSFKVLKGQRRMQKLSFYLLFWPITVLDGPF